MTRLVRAWKAWVWTTTTGEEEDLGPMIVAEVLVLAWRAETASRLVSRVAVAARHCLVRGGLHEFSRPTRALRIVEAAAAAAAMRRVVTEIAQHRNLKDSRLEGGIGLAPGFVGLTDTGAMF